jgi:membrane protein DedA with SNARE-associated domain
MALGVLLLMIPESACIPVPSEATLMAAGFAVSRGGLSLPAAVAAGTAGNLIGSLIAYTVGRAGPVPDPIARRSDRLFERYGKTAVFVARLLPLARSFISLPAGHARVPISDFIFLTIAGCAIWSAVFVVAGQLTGSAWREVSGVVGHIALGCAALVLLWALLRRPASRASRSRPRSAE